MRQNYSRKANWSRWGPYLAERQVGKTSLIHHLIQESDVSGSGGRSERTILSMATAGATLRTTRRGRGLTVGGKMVCAAV